MCCTKNVVPSHFLSPRIDPKIFSDTTKTQSWCKNLILLMENSGGNISPKENPRVDIKCGPAQSSLFITFLGQIKLKFSTYLIPAVQANCLSLMLSPSSTPAFFLSFFINVGWEGKHFMENSIKLDAFFIKTFPKYHH